MCKFSEPDLDLLGNSGVLCTSLSLSVWIFPVRVRHLQEAKPWKKVIRVNYGTALTFSLPAAACWMFSWSVFLAD